MEKASASSPFDQPQITEVLFYPRRIWWPAPSGASDHLIPVGDGVGVSARSYLGDAQFPNVLFFHGNGEIACEYDDIASSYHRAGANLFVADFRGYGQSGGNPSFSTMVADAAVICRYWRGMLAATGCDGARFVMGRSLGAYSAVEAAAEFQDELKGLISESGAALTERLAARLGFDLDLPGLREAINSYKEKLASIHLPLLVIHGEADDLIPLESAFIFSDAVGSVEKTMIIIPQAGHNDLLGCGMDQYFDALRIFLGEHTNDGAHVR